MAGFLALPLSKPEGDLAEFRSPLMWDVLPSAPTSAFSLLVWYLGLMPDFASLRDRTKEQDPQVFLRGAGRGLAGIRIALAPLRESLPDYRRDRHGLVLSVHSVVSFDFAVSLVPAGT